MVEVFLLTTDPTSSKVGKVSAWFDSLQESLPNKLHLIDLRHQRFFEKRPEETLIVRVDEIEAVDPDNLESLRQVLIDATNRANSPDYRPTGAKDRLSGRERFSLWFSRHYLALVNIIVAVYVFLPILAPVMMKRLTVTGSPLRARPVEDEAPIARSLQHIVWPLLAGGVVRPVIDRVFPLSEAAAAHALMESNRHIGKLLLQVG